MIRTTPEQPYSYAGQYRAGAYAGGTAYLGGEPCGSSSLTTYDELEALLAGDTFRRLAEGAYIFDKRRVGDRGVAEVIGGPMLDSQLPVLTIRSWDDARTFDTLAAALACEDTHRAMTFVSLDVYAAIWRELGCRIGRKVGVAIAWEGDESEGGAS